MAHDETPSWLDQPSEPEDNNQKADLPPWLREDADEASAPPPVEESSLPPWLRKPDEEREMLRGEKLSDEWLSDADALVESVDTELTYDEWQAMQDERARPKSIEEEVPDLLSDLPSEEDPAAAQSRGVTGELPDWFLGLEEMDTSDAPDWFMNAAEEPAPPPSAPTEEPPSWINDLQQAEDETPEPEDRAVDDFFDALNREPTLPSGVSMDDLFGEFAMSSPAETDHPDEDTLDWMTGHPQASTSADDSTASEMDDFFLSLSRSAAPAPAPPPVEEDLPESSALLSRLPSEPEPEPEDFPPLHDLGTRRLDQQPADFSQFLDDDLPEPEPDAFAQVPDDEGSEIEEPDLEWFMQAAADSPVTAPLPDIDIEPEVPEPSDEDLNSTDTLNWLSELENIVTSVAREEEPVFTPEDFFPVEPEAASEPEAGQVDEPSAGRGDDFDWPEPEPYVDPETEPEPQNWFDQFNLPNVEPQEESETGESASSPSGTRLTGMLNRLREAQEASVQDVTPEEMSPDDDLDSLLLTEDLLAEAGDAQFALPEPEVEDLFADMPDTLAAEPEAESDWESLDLDALISEASAGEPSPQPQAPADFDQLENYSFEDLLNNAAANQEQPVEDTPDAESITGTGTDEGEYESAFSDMDDITVDDLYPAEWDAAPEPEAAGQTAGAAVDFGTADGEVDEELYQSQWGTAAEPAAEAAEALYEPQWGAVADEDDQPDWELSQPDLSAPLADESAETESPEDDELGDTSWLTDDIFLEIGNIAAEEAEAEDTTAASAEPEAYAEAEFAAFETEASLFDEALTNEQTAEASQLEQEYTASWDVDEEEAPELAEDDFLAELRNEQPPVAETDDAVSEADDLGILWDADEEEAPEPAEAAAVPADDDFLQMLQPEAESETDEPPQAAGFDENFLASLDTLDQMQASGQSHVGDDLFPALLEDESEAVLDEIAAVDEAAELPGDEDDLDWLTADLDDDAALAGKPYGAPDADQQPQAELDEDFFASLDAELPSDEDEDLFASLGAELPADDGDDFFREMGMAETPAEPQPEMNWLTDLNDDTVPDEDEPFTVGAASDAAADDEPAWLKALGGDDELDSGSVSERANDWFTETELPDDLPAAVEDELPADEPIKDLDSYLASLTGQEAALSRGTKELLAQDDFDIDALLESPLIDENSPPSAQAPPFIDTAEHGETPEWLTDVQATVTEVSAGAMVRQLKDRPEGELDDRLKKLRKRGGKVPAASASAGDDSLADVLPDVEDTLSPVQIRASAPTLVGTVALSADQKAHVALLKTLVNTEEEPAPRRMSAIDMTYDNAPYQLDLEEDGASIIQPDRPAQTAPAARRSQSRRRGRVLPRIRIDRLLITLLLAGGILAPFLLPGFRVGTLPAPTFVAGSAQQDAFAQISRLEPGSLVLFAIEYSPAAAAELDPMTDALLRHVLLRNAYPVIISGNPLALLRAGNLLEAISADEAFRDRLGVRRALQPNRDYYLVRYLPGSTIGLRAFSADTARLLLTDIRGQATGLDVLSLRDFPVIVVVADQAEDVRGYAEQVAPLARASMIAAVSYSAAPLVEPYISAEVLNGPPALTGLLIGYGDAYTYNTLIGNIPSVARSIRPAAPIIRTTPDPTAMPPATPTPLFTPTPVPLGTAVVTATQAVNMRPEPNTNNAPIGQLSPGDEVAVLGFNNDRSWVQVRLDDGREGWISAQLVAISVDQSSLPKQADMAKARYSEPDRGVGAQRAAPPFKNQHKSTGIASPILQDAGDDGATEAPNDEATAESTETEAGTATRTPRPTRTTRPAESAAEATPEVTADAGQIVLPPHSPGYRDERWYAMTAGIIISVTVISFGTVVNIVRSILRRRR